MMYKLYVWFYQARESKKWNFVPGYENELLSQGQEFRDQIQSLTQTMNFGK